MVATSTIVLTPTLVEGWMKGAVKEFWGTRDSQGEAGGPDQGNRSKATGGGHLDGFNRLFGAIARDCGFTDDEIFYSDKLRQKKKRKTGDPFVKGLELPGFYRPTKQWDFIVVRKGKLILAIECKSHVGPSFGNNYNNRVEEALGMSDDVHTAFRESTFGDMSFEPWLGYFFVLEKSPDSLRHIESEQPHFPIRTEFYDPGFVNLKGPDLTDTFHVLSVSYAERYRLFCEKLIKERKYNSVSLLVAPKDNPGDYDEHTQIGPLQFCQRLQGHLNTSHNLLGV